MTTKPKLKDIHQYITPRYAVEWIELGLLLDLTIEELTIIRYDNHDKAESCCNGMFKKWLEKDKFATWKKLFNAIESLKRRSLNGFFTDELHTCE